MRNKRVPNLPILIYLDQSDFAYDIPPNIIHIPLSQNGSKKHEAHILFRVTLWKLLLYLFSIDTELNVIKVNIVFTQWTTAKTFLFLWTTCDSLQSAHGPLLYFTLNTASDHSLTHSLLSQSHAQCLVPLQSSSADNTCYLQYTSFTHPLFWANAVSVLLLSTCLGQCKTIVNINIFICVAWCWKGLTLEANSCCGFRSICIGVVKCLPCSWQSASPLEVFYACFTPTLYLRVYSRLFPPIVKVAKEQKNWLML